MHDGSAQLQRPLPDSTQHSQEADIHAPAGFEPAIPASERPQTDALDSAASGICRNLIIVNYVSSDCEKYSNKNILRSAGKISKSCELVGNISEAQPPPLHFFKKNRGGVLTKNILSFPHSNDRMQAQQKKSHDTV